MSGVIIRGGCFRFHVPTFGFGGGAARTHDVLLDGVHMDSFECVGCANVTIRRSEVGPVNACGGPSYPDAHSRCDPANPVEAYYATRSDGTPISRSSRSSTTERQVARRESHYSETGSMESRLETRASGTPVAC